jgi:hypothetical protein
MTVLTELAPMLANGTVIVFDEMFNYPSYEKHELRALFDFMTAPERKGMWFEWIGKQGVAELHPKADTGAESQAAAIRIVRK